MRFRRRKPDPESHEKRMAWAREQAARDCVMRAALMRPDLDEIVEARLAAPIPANASWQMRLAVVKTVWAESWSEAVRPEAAMAALEGDDPRLEPDGSTSWAD